jgi:hypothetical protein
MISRELAAFKSITGVEGTFLFNQNGTLLGRDLSNLYTSELVGSVQGQLVHLLQAITQYLGAYDDIFLRFNERVIFARRSEELVVFVIASPRCDPDNLRMGSNLLLGQVRKLLANGIPVRPPGITPPVPSGPFGGRPAVRQPNRPIAPSAPAPNRMPPKPKSDGIWG